MPHPFFLSFQSRFEKGKIEREGLSSVPEERNFPREASHRFLVFFFFFFYNMYIFTYIQHPLTSGPGGAPAGQALLVRGGKAPSQPRQHPSNRIG